MEYGMMSEQKSEIAYQNKDITSKVFAEKLVGKSFNVYGFHLPKVKRVLPTNLPTIQADELRLDNLFLLEDGSLALIDYESAYKEENKVKYLNYIARIVSQYYSVYKKNLKIKILIIYTADVQENQTKDFWNLDSVTLTLQQAFLSALDSESIKENLTRKIQNQEPLSEEEMMQFIILPLTYQGEEKKNKAIKELFQLSKSIEEEAVQLFLLSGILVFTDKVIDEETAKRIKEWISMTKVARLFEEEKQEALKNALQAKDRNTVEKLLKKGVDMDFIMDVTGLTKEEIKKIEKDLLVTKE